MAVRISGGFKKFDGGLKVGTPANSNQKLYDAIVAEGLTSQKIVLDATDSSSYGGSGTLITDLSGNHNYNYDGNTSFVGSAGSTDAYFRSTNQQGGWTPTTSTTSWSDALHKAGGKWSCIIVANATNGSAIWPTFFNTWNNTTSSTGMATRIEFGPSGFSGFNVVAWRSSSNRSLQMQQFFTAPGGWTFIGLCFGDNVPSYVRYNDSAVNDGGWRTGGNVSYTNFTGETLSESYVSPTTSNATDSMYILGLPGTNNSHNGTVDVKCLAVFDDNLSPTQMSNIYNNIKDRYI